MGLRSSAGAWLKDKAKVDLGRLKQIAMENNAQWRESAFGPEEGRAIAAQQPAFIPDDNGRPIDVADLDNVRDLSRGEQLVARAARYPVRAAGVAGGIYIADQFLGKPVEGVIDAVTLGLTNFRENETRGMTFGDGGSVPYSIPYAQGTALDANGNVTPSVSAPVPPMDEKALAYQIKRQRDNIAVNSVTLRELEAMQNEARQNTGYFG